MASITTHTADHSHGGVEVRASIYEAHNSGFQGTFQITARQSGSPDYLRDDVSLIFKASTKLGVMECLDEVRKKVNRAVFAETTGDGDESFKPELRGALRTIKGQGFTVFSREDHSALLGTLSELSSTVQHDLDYGPGFETEERLRLERHVANAQRLLNIVVEGY